MVDAGADRRVHPRVDSEMPAHIVGHKGHEQITLEMYNLSCSGLYCRLPMYVSPFTRLKIVVFLPTRDGNQTVDKEVEFEGVVVRTDPEQEAPGVKQYHLAIFFEGLTDQVRSLITKYVAQHR